MSKTFKLVYIVLLVSVSPLLFGQEASVTMDVPQNVNAGADFEVKITINKGSLTDYSRFSQELPYGLSATNVSSPNADFSFEEQRVRIIWLKLPDEEVIDVVYQIHVDERLKGTFNLEGNFAFVVDEERKYANISSSGDITITPDPTISQSLIIDIKDFESVVLASSEAQEVKGYAMVIRQKPILMDDGSVLVKLLVKNPEESKYAKIEETIPGGYLFEEMESHEGIVSFSTSTVKFIWMKLPDEPEFMVSYKLIPKSGEAQEALTITGVFTYTTGNVSFEDPIIEMDVNLAGLSETARKELLLTGTVPTAYQTQTADPVAEEPVTESKVVETTGVASGGVIEGTRVLEPAEGNSYRIQLVALRKPFNGELHFSRLGIKNGVRVEQQEGLYKYTVGPFSSYVSASSYKKSLLKKRQDMSEVFIVAYRNGSRISIEQALGGSY